MTAPHKLTAAMRQHKPKLRSTKTHAPNLLRPTSQTTQRSVRCRTSASTAARNASAASKSPRAGTTSATRSPHAWPTGTTLRATLAGLAPPQAFLRPITGRESQVFRPPASEPQRVPLALQVGTGASQAPYAPHMFPDRPCPASGRPPLTNARYAARTKTP